MRKNKRLNPTEKSKANPNSRLAAMNAKCFDCCCEQYREVTLCKAKDCPLWLLRPWQKNETSKKGEN